MKKSSTSAVLFKAVRETFHHGELLLTSLDEEVYRTRVALAFNASIGGHYRHCLDHFISIFKAMDSAEVDYDNRCRDERVENNRLFALCVTQVLIARCKELRRNDLDRPIMVRNKVSYSGESSTQVPSTVARELMYAVTHAIHHYALIKVMCGIQGVELPEAFGVAPSTVKHNSKKIIRAGRDSISPCSTTGLLPAVAAAAA
ncbi:MAG: DinB family protein [Candidatus Methylacidiphilales bacterium]|nr:hypothetical protein [Candidatus Methylacidiphilales bacterium]